jgi:hypothetical protein
MAASALISVTQTVGTEGSNAITVAVRAKRDKLSNVAQGRLALRAWLSTDTGGEVPANGIFAPNGGTAGGADGAVIPHHLPPDRITPTAALLAIDATATKFKLITNTVTYYVGGTAYTKAPATAILFSAAHVVSASKFGVVLVQVDTAGVVTTKVPLATQAYTTAALALAALPAPDAGNVALGYIAIAAGVGAWTANTSDLTNGSGLTTATFVNAPANGAYPTVFTVLTETNGHADVVISETRVSIKPLYLNIDVPGVGVSVSGPIAFA